MRRRLSYPANCSENWFLKMDQNCCCKKAAVFLKLPSASDPLPTLANSDAATAMYCCNVALPFCIVLYGDLMLGVRGIGVSGSMATLVGLIQSPY